MRTYKYTEEEMQDFASGAFAGDLTEFEDYLKDNPEFAAEVKAYQELYILLATQNVPSLSYDLSDRVVERISKTESSKEPAQFQLLNLLAFACVLVALIIIFRQFEFEIDYSGILESTLFIPIACFIVVFSIGTYFIEMQQMKRKMSV